ncbi:integrase catalytic domain-containing protein [Trichonephila clavipes]|nr:integrase catalytic domain-containing protein [Trichonephila clavipes]
MCSHSCRTLRTCVGHVHKVFLLALRRFLARRGNCKVIYSDNARTFKAAERELTYFANILKDSEFQSFVADKGIHWKFIVERAPWWGGFYERLVKTIKDPLRKILGRALLTFEELSTILSEVEVIVNHRPLTYVENDPGEPEPLTPAHFLELGYGDSKYPIHFIELIDATTAKESYKKRKTYRTLLLKQLWRRWKEQYLLQLKTANHFKTPSVHKNLKLNDVVLVEGNVKSKLLWELGIIKEIFIGRDDNNTALPAKIHVVNDETIRLDAIIGIDFLQQTKFTFGRDGIRIFRDVDECKNDDVLVNLANLFDEQQCKLDLPHISNSKIRNDVEQLFIPNYARIARPLSDLLRDNVKFKFGPTEIASFQELKNILSENPVLHVFQQGYPLELHTDASSLGFGAVLLQKSDDGLFHPLSLSIILVAKLQFNRRNIAAMNYKY